MLPAFRGITPAPAPQPSRPTRTTPAREKRKKLGGQQRARERQRSDTTHVGLGRAAAMYQAIPYSSAGRPSWLMPAADVVVVKPEPMSVVTVAARAGGEDEVVSRPAEPAPDAVVDSSAATATAAAQEEEVGRAVAESPVLVVGRPGCCLSHVVKRLLQGLGVNPAVHEVADEAALAGIVVPTADLPAVFVGGKLLGGLDRLMAVHISGELVPILKKAGALWL